MQRYSDILLLEYQIGQPVLPLQADRSTVIFESLAAGRIELKTTYLRLEMAGISLVTVNGIGSYEENMFLNFSMQDVEG